MPDDRALRDALETVQAEVKALREQLGREGAWSEVHERIAQLEALRAQQREKLAQSEAEVVQVQAQLSAVEAELAEGKVQLQALREHEARLVDLTVLSLDPGQARSSGCALLLLAFAAGLLELLR
jgi:septal ring factor EnvC (AmiA/AmiB activator)